MEKTFFVNLSRHTYETRGQKINHFLIGFAGWFVLNTVVGGALSFGMSLLSAAIPADNADAQNILGYAALGLSCLSLLLNVGLLIYFGFTRYWIALGALAAFAVVLLLILCISVIVGVLCFGGLAGLGRQP